MKTAAREICSMPFVRGHIGKFGSPHVGIEIWGICSQDFTMNCAYALQDAYRKTAAGEIIFPAAVFPYIDMRLQAGASGQRKRNVLRRYNSNWAETKVCLSKYAVPVSSI